MSRYIIRDKQRPVAAFTFEGPNEVQALNQWIERHTSLRMPARRLVRETSLHVVDRAFRIDKYTGPVVVTKTTVTFTRCHFDLAPNAELAVVTSTRFEYEPGVYEYA